MKTKLITLCLVLVSWGAFAQHDHGGGKTPALAHKKEDANTYRATPVFQKQLGDVFITSLLLKEALVSSDPAKASASTTEIKTSLAKVDLTMLKDEALMDWMGYLKIINESLEQISVSTDVVAQRKTFASFNDALYKSIKMFGAGGTTIYYQYCPMANNNAGAYWLSIEKEIRNPYFGDKMLKWEV